MIEARHLLISGRVQGVGYRDWAARTARRLELSGWVRNLRDGRVELVACGESAALEALEDACREGPALAQVDDIEAEAIEAPGSDGFKVRPTA